MVGLVVSAVAAVSGLSRLQWWQIAALATWMVAPALSSLFLGSLQDGRFWTVAIASTAVGFAGVLMPADLRRRLLVGLGWFYGWGSVLVAVSQLVFGGPIVIVGGDPRYGRWLSALGLPVSDVGSLNGLTPGRIFLAMNCGLLLVYVVRLLLRDRSGWRGWLMPLGLVLALGWSFGRVGLFAAVLGLVGAAVPWQRWRPVWPFLAAVAVFALPLGVSRVLTLGKGTTQWRFDLWDKYFGAGIWGPFGIGPQTPPDPIRGHAHNQLLETLASGGWIGIAGLLAFLFLGFVAAARVAVLDNRATYAVLFGMCAVFASDVVTFAPTFTILNSAFVIGVVVILGASPPHHRLLRETPDPAYG